MPDAEPAWRCFVAVPIPEALRDALRGYVADLRADSARADGWRWTDAEAWHVTLAFLGATAEADVPAITDALRGSTVDADPFVVSGFGLGAFPRPSRARVLWYGIADQDGKLGTLARAVQEALGLDVPPRFQGHLTLARARDRNGTDGAAVLAGARPPQAEIPVDRVVLYRSHLGRGPARYEAISTVLIAGRTP